MHLVHEIWEALDREQLSPRFLIDLAKEHFSALCPVCADEFRRFQEDRGRALPSVGVAARVLGEQVKRLEREERQARRDVLELLATPAGGRADKLRRTPQRFRGPAVIDGLLARYWEVFYPSPRQAYEIAELAWAVAQASHGAARIYELMALAASHAGNAARASGDLGQADRWFVHTREILEGKDVRAVTVLAKIDLLEGLLRKDQRRFTAAVELLGRSLALYRLTGMRIDVVRVLINLGEAHSCRGQIREAKAKAQEALVLLDRETEPRLYLCAQHNLALYLSQEGRHAQAAQILDANRDLYETQGDRWTTLHRCWLAGRIAAGLGHCAEAEESLLAARDGFLLQGIAYDAALVSLDLAALYLEQHRTAEVRALAEEIVTVFRAQDIHREAMAAWLIFREAAEHEVVSAMLIRKLTRYLEESRSEPASPFGPAI